VVRDAGRYKFTVLESSYSKSFYVKEPQAFFDIFNDMTFLKPLSSDENVDSGQLVALINHKNLEIRYDHS
jgi:hypothetical protein